VTRDDEPPDHLDALRAAVLAGRRVRFRFFWGHTPRADGKLSDACFSQWWKCAFAVDGIRYASAEHFMMAEKARLFGDDDTRARILAAKQPADAKRLGRLVTGFDEAAWARAREAIVTAGNVAKFGQDERMRAYLMSTGGVVLVEASPRDRIWGIGLAADHRDASDPAKWRGKNLLGFALVRARAQLSAASTSPSPDRR
jgi:ribA/ribD-fused uncharacterized protein